MRSGFLFLFFLLTLMTKNSGQENVSILSYHSPGSTYSQSFDGLPNSGTFTVSGKGPFNLNGSPFNGNALNGWQVMMSGGTNPSASFSVSTGSSTGNGIYSLGSAGASDRALGSLSASTGIYAFGLVITNASGDLLNRVTISFTSEQWRKGGSGNKNTWSGKYATGIFNNIQQNNLKDAPGLSFSSTVFSTGAASLDGNLAINQQKVTFLIDSIAWKSGEQLLLRWDDADEPGSDDAVGLDNFSLVAEQISLLPSLRNLKVTDTNWNSVTVQFEILDNNAKTGFFLETDTSQIFLAPIKTIPVPDTLQAGTGWTNINLPIPGLQPNHVYYTRVKAINANGLIYGPTLRFTTSPELPKVITHLATSVTTQSALLNGSITFSDSTLVTARGMVWSEKSLPTLSDNRINMGMGSGNFQGIVEGLPQSTLVFVRAFATYQSETVYGNQISFYTLTKVLSLVASATGKTNKDTISFELKMAQPINGLSKDNFRLQSTGIQEPAIVEVIGSGMNYSVRVKTGLGDGNLQLLFENDLGVLPSIANLSPFVSDVLLIDKTPPSIQSVSIPDKPIKIGDTLMLTIMLSPDSDSLILVSGMINGFPVYGFSKKNDSTYMGYCIPASGGKDLADSALIPVQLDLKDAAGNIKMYNLPIKQTNDPIDVNRPYIINLMLPSNGLYKMGDSLEFVIRFNEKIRVTMVASLISYSITIGTKIKSASYIGGSGYDSLLFRYTILSGDADKDGIKPSSLLNTNYISDLLGNMALPALSDIPSAKYILVDGVPPSVSSVQTPAAGNYRTSDTLHFNLNFSEKIRMDTTRGIPSLTVWVGTQSINAPGQLDTMSGLLHFYYVVDSKDRDMDGIKLGPELNLNGSKIKDEAGNDASTLLHNIGALSKIFINPVSAAKVITQLPNYIATQSAELGGTITDSGGVAILEKGIIWATASNPTLASHKVVMGIGSGAFTKTVEDLPQGTPLHVRAYAINEKGTSYGSDMLFSTKTSILSISPLNAVKNNRQNVFFQILLAQNISGFSVSNCQLSVTGIDSSFISGISGSGKNYSVNVNTGKGDGSIRLTLLNDNDISPPVSNLPITSGFSFTIDKTPPIIQSVNIPEHPMKVGDTIPIIIKVNQDGDSLLLSSGEIDGFPVKGLAKLDDSSYKAYFIITNGGKDVPAMADISVSLILTDPAGNNCLVYQQPIKGLFDPIDANKPFVKSLVPPANGLYKIGDSLDFIFRFSEQIKLSASGALSTFSITIGSSVKKAVYVSGTGTDSLLYRYIIQTGDSEANGIKPASSLSINSNDIRDEMGNSAITNLPNTGTLKQVVIDGVAPLITNVSTPTAGTFKTGNLLDFIVNFSEKVWVEKLTDLPFLSITIGSKIQQAKLHSGSGSTSLLFRWQVLPGDASKVGIKLDNNLYPNNAFIKDEAGNNATTTLKNIGALSKIIINPITATTMDVIVPKNGVYTKGDSLLFLVRFNEIVFCDTTTGVPSLKIIIGSAIKNANYINGSGTDTLRFRYQIQPGEEDNKGIKLNSTLTLNNGEIRDVLQNPVPLTLSNIPKTDSILVDAVPPTIKSVIIPSKKIYVEGDTLLFITNFSEPVLVSFQNNSVNLPFVLGTQSKKAMYLKGHNTDALTFRYIVMKNDLDKNGIRLDSIIDAGNASIHDRSGNIAILVLKNVGAVSGIKIDAVAPEFNFPISEIDSLCVNNEGKNISGLLQVKNDESGELLTWDLLFPPLHGKLSKEHFTASSISKTITPNGIIYQQESGFTGMDSLQFQVSDGVNSSIKKIRLVIYPSIANNQIGPSQTICTNNTPSLITGTIPTGGTGQYQLTWETSKQLDTMSFLKATGNYSGQHYSPSKLVQSSVFRRKVVSGECVDLSSHSSVIVLANGVWTGSINNDWNFPGNWCNNLVPVKQTDVIVLANTPHFPVIRDSAYCNQLTLEKNAYLENKGILLINSGISDSMGSIQSVKGTLLFNGLSSQKIPARIFENQTINNLIINNPTEVVLRDSLLLTGKLLMQKGALFTNNLLRLSASAQLGPSASATSIKGNVSVEHLIGALRPGYRLLGNPFRNTYSLNRISDSIDITGQGGIAKGFIKGPNQQPSAFWFDPIAANDSLGFEHGWVPFTNTNGGELNSWDPFTGIRLWVRGRPGQGLDGIPAGDGSNGTYLPQPVNIVLTGALQTGDLELGLSIGKPASFHLISNPYISNINTSYISRGRNISNHFWIWNPYQGKTGGYSCLSFRDNYVLKRFNTFIVKVYDSSNNWILFKENCKTGEPFSDTLTASNETDAYQLELRLESDSVFWDRLLLLAIDSARSGIDRQDAEKIPNPEVNFYSLSRERKMLSIDARPISKQTIIPLGLQTTEFGNFRIKVTRNSLPPAYALMLYDKYLDNWLNLDQDSSYYFYLGMDTLSRGNNRFEISARKLKSETGINYPRLDLKLSPVPATDQVNVLYDSPNWGNSTITVISFFGNTVKHFDLGVQKKGRLSISVSDLLKGVYVIKFQCGNRFTTKKLVKG